MLADRDLQLLTAYIDGDLSTRQRKTAVRLLRKSPEARAVLQQLQNDSRSVRDLTRLKLGPDFPLKVMRTIAQTGIRPTAASRPRAPGASPWATVAMAASVLLLIAGASYWYFVPRQGVRLEGPFVVHRPVEAAPAIVAVRPLDPLAARVFQGTFGQFNQAGLRLAVQDLNKPATRRRLAAELRRDNAYHVDVAVQDSGKAVNELSRVLKKNGVEVLMTAGALTSLQQKQPRTRYVLYAENLSPDELASILQQVGGHPRHGAQASSGDAIEQLVVNAMTPEHRQQLSTLLGVPANRLQPARKGSSDPPADLLNKTIIEGKAAGQGTRPVSPSPKTAPRRDGRLAVVLAVNQDTSANPADSPYVRMFVSGRRQQRPGTLQVLLVVHDTSV